jgi:predicted NUDIX family NTP pyrophosphohydrolase
MKKSAGILFYRYTNKALQFFLVHPGGPYWQNKDEGKWSIPKGEFSDDEDPLDAAIREVKEETGVICKGNFIELSAIKQKGGKFVYAWALEQDIDAEKISSNNFEMEWPPRSGVYKQFPEVDKAGWFDEKEAKARINIAQRELIDELILLLKDKRTLNL